MGTPWGGCPPRPVRFLPPSHPVGPGQVPPFDPPLCAEPLAIPYRPSPFPLPRSASRPAAGAARGVVSCASGVKERVMMGEIISHEAIMSRE
jgi:hypothetical protein